MKKYAVLFLFLGMIFWGGVASGSFVTVDEGLNLSVPQAKYRGECYALELLFHSDSQGGYWVPGAVSRAASCGGEYTDVSDDFGITVSCAEYRGDHYTLFLNHYDEPGGTTWRVNSLFSVANSIMSREVSPNVESSELSTLVGGMNGFNFSFYQALAEGEGNLFFSPYSIQAALAMAYAGAENQTQSQMASALGITLFEEPFHRAFNRLNQILASRGQGAAGIDGGEFRLNISNSLWGHTGYSFSQSFLDTLAVNYGARMGLLDFSADPEGSRGVINNWVEDRTEGRIEDLIPQGAISSLTRLVLTNAIYFNAAWLSPFDTNLTMDGEFYPQEGETVSVPMMSQAGMFPYAETQDCRAIELPYDGGELSMVILLPQQGRFDAYESSMTQESVEDLIDAMTSRNLSLSMPRFTFEGGAISLKQFLSGMGMVDAFTASADFSGIDGGLSLMISDVFHKAFIAVDEAGTEAAAATAVIFVETAVPEPPLPMNINRPFIYLIRDRQTGTILFMGRLLNPSQ